MPVWADGPWATVGAALELFGATALQRYGTTTATGLQGYRTTVLQRHSTTELLGNRAIVPLGQYLSCHARPRWIEQLREAGICGRGDQLIKSAKGTPNPLIFKVSLPPLPSRHPYLPCLPSFIPAVPACLPCLACLALPVLPCCLPSARLGSPRLRRPCRTHLADSVCACACLRACLHACLRARVCASLCVGAYMRGMPPRRHKQ